jgi:hypothetical protein
MEEKKMNLQEMNEKDFDETMSELKATLKRLKKTTEETERLNKAAKERRNLEAGKPVIINGNFEFIAINAKLPTRSMKKLQEYYGEDGIRFSCKKPSKDDEDQTYEVRMSFGPETNVSNLMDAEVEMMKCLVHVAPKSVESK